MQARQVVIGAKYGTNAFKLWFWISNGWIPKCDYYKEIVHHYPRIGQECKQILRNQACAGLWPMHTWFNNYILRVFVNFVGASAPSAHLVPLPMIYVTHMSVPFTVSCGWFIPEFITTSYHLAIFYTHYLAICVPHIYYTLVLAVSHCCEYWYEPSHVYT